MVDADLNAEMKERASEIFQNIFSDIFLANCGNPVDLDQTKTAFQQAMGPLQENQIEDMEQFFYDADTDNVSGFKERVYGRY